MTVREFLSFSVKENVKTNLIIFRPGGKQLYNGAADRLKDTDILDEILAAGTYSLGKEPDTVELLIVLKERRTMQMVADKLYRFIIIFDKKCAVTHKYEQHPDVRSAVSRISELERYYKGSAVIQVDEAEPDYSPLFEKNYYKMVWPENRKSADLVYSPSEEDE